MVRHFHVRHFQRPRFLCSFSGFFNKATTYTLERMFTQNTQKDVVPAKEMPLGSRILTGQLFCGQKLLEHGGAQI